jgi:hypothetical protein
VEGSGSGAVPTEDVKEQVVFASFFERDFNLPVGDFVDGVFWYTKHVHYTLVWI